MAIDDSIQSHLVTSSSWSLSYYSSGVQKPQLDKFQEQANELGCVAHFQSILEGVIVNTSEKRSVRHHACRDPQHSFYQSQLAELESLVEWQQSGSFSFDHIVYVGIGGSFLGPKLLDHSARLIGLSSSVSVSFISSIDPHEVYSILNSLTVSRTLFIVVSKSGSTRETLDNIEMIRSYLVQNGHSEASHRNQFMAITTQGSQLDDENLFVKRLYIDEAVGGRFSISSVVGMALLALSFGVSAVHEFLEGANEMDQSALNSNITENLSLFTAFLNRYYRESCGYSARAVVPYCSALMYLPDYLQQLICESLGKPSDTLSGPLVTGGIGPNIQHSLFQHFHDSSDSVPIQFIAIKRASSPEYQSYQTVLNQHCVSQLVSFLKRPQSMGLVPKPTSLLFTDSLTLKSLGALIAYYENTVTFEGFLYGINAYDQPAVEYGKSLMRQMESADVDDDLLRSFQALMD